jgi:transposase
MLRTRIDRICRVTGYSLQQLQTRTNENEYTFRRYIVMNYLLTKGFRTEEIAAIFKLDRSTVYHAVRVIRNATRLRNPLWVYKLNEKVMNCEPVKEEEETFIYKSLTA